VHSDVLDEHILNILKLHPSISVETSDERLELAQFANDVPMKMGAVSLVTHRTGNYFESLSSLGERFFVFTSRHAGKICALGSVVFRKSWYGGVPCEVGYLLELRFATDLGRRARHEFFSFYAAMLKQSPNLALTKGCKHYYSAILSNNLAARKSLSRIGFGVRYQFLSGYRSTFYPKVVMPGLGKLVQRMGRTFSGASACSKVTAEQQEFLAEHSTHPTFGMDWNHAPFALESGVWIEVRRREQIVALAFLSGEKQPRAYRAVLSSGRPIDLPFSRLMCVTLSKSLSASERKNFTRRLFRRAYWKAYRWNVLALGISHTPDCNIFPKVSFGVPGLPVEGGLYRIVHEDWPADILCAGILGPQNEFAIELGLI
jgi:hypothetical protein